uniref:Ig-like domain-containing protein n=1 Tax=Poecilia formosa TaxID=48698 RepID=A0A087X452_POEFO
MDSLSATSLFSALIFIIVFVSSVSTDQTNITAHPGQNTSLPCRSPDNKPVIVVEWIRPDLGSEYVLLYRDDQLDPENQHVMFKDRVDLQDRQMKDGNVSLVLRNVTTDDRGAYECRVVQRETNSRTETVFIINLDVLPPPGEINSEFGKEPGFLFQKYIIVFFFTVAVRWAHMESQMNRD